MYWTRNITMYSFWKWDWLNSNFSSNGLILNFCECIVHKNSLVWRSFLTLKWVSTWVFQPFFLHHNRSRMTQLIIPNKEFILIRKLLVYHDMHFNCTNIYVVQIIQLIMSNKAFILIRKLLVYHDMHFNCTNKRVVQTIRDCW